MASARGERVPPDGRAAGRVLQPPALLRPGTARGLGQVGRSRGSAGRSRSRPIRVVTWNIRAAIGPGEPFPPAWWRHVRRDRLERIAAVLASLDADVVTLQEVTIMNVDGEIHDQPADLAGFLGCHARYGAVHVFPLVEPETGRSIGSASWGNAILTRAPIRDGFVAGLPRAGDDDLLEPPGYDHPLAGVRYGDTEPGHREARCAVGGRVVLDGGAEVAVVTAHLTYIGHSQRESQAAALAAIAAALPQPMIVTGDFNASLDAPELAPLAGSFDDAFESVGLGLDDPRRRTCGPFGIDHVLTRGLTAESCSVVTEAADASDHLPVLATLAQVADGSIRAS